MNKQDVFDNLELAQDLITREGYDNEFLFDEIEDAIIKLKNASELEFEGIYESIHRKIFDLCNIVL